MKSVLRVTDPGTYTTVQDTGRIGYRQFGVPPAGCLDRFSHRVANILVGNQDGAAVLEMTFMGASFEVLKMVDLALTGAEMPLSVNNRAVAPWSKFRVKPGDHVNIGQASNGCRGYLAISGGVKVPKVMGSRSSYVGARIGGLEGRSLKRGDAIASYKIKLVDGDRRVPSNWIPLYPKDITLRAIPGPQEEYFIDSLSTFFGSAYTFSSQTDRKGCRLQGTEIKIQTDLPKSIISEPCLAGCIQVPEDGQPIILLGEQTVGGYAKIATVISADLDIIAQAMPGDRVQFENVDIDTAYELASQQYRRLEMLRQNIVSTPPRKKSARAVWNMDPAMFCSKVHSHLNQVRPSRRSRQEKAVNYK